jgi:deoxyribonuclease-2
MLVLFSAFALARISCRNTEGQDVDWWAAWKVNVKPAGRTPKYGSAAYFYRDPKTSLMEADGEVLGVNKNAIYNSIAAAYSKNASVGYAFFNDQPPEGEVSSTYAHQKGVMVFDDDNGVLLSHSVPHFGTDPQTGGYSYPDSGLRYAQGFQCMTFSHKSLDEIAAGYLISRPHHHASNFPSYADAKLPNLKRVLDGEYLKDVESNVSIVPTLGGVNITYFTKARAWGKDIYHDLIGSYFKQKILAESWSNGVGTFDSDCSPPEECHNILYVSFDGVEWKRSQNHAKWALVGDTVCVGDNNRQSGQLKRGGTSYCITDAKYAKEIAQAIVEVEECPKNVP